MPKTETEELPQISLDFAVSKNGRVTSNTRGNHSTFIGKLENAREFWRGGWIIEVNIKPVKKSLRYFLWFTKLPSPDTSGQCRLLSRNTRQPSIWWDVTHPMMPCRLVDE